jgi:hypothetical protein
MREAVVREAFPVRKIALLQQLHRLLLKPEEGPQLLNPCRSDPS